MSSLSLDESRYTGSGVAVTDLSANRSISGSLLDLCRLKVLLDPCLLSVLTIGSCTGNAAVRPAPMGSLVVMMFFVRRIPDVGDPDNGVICTASWSRVTSFWNRALSTLDRESFDRGESGWISSTDTIGPRAFSRSVSVFPAEPCVVAEQSDGEVRRRDRELLL